MLQKVSFVLLVLAIALITTNLPAQIVEDGLVSYWSFDANKISGKTVTDGTGNYDGTIKGNLKKVTGKIGDALEFDGNEANFVEIDSPEEFDFNVDFTWSAWIKTDSSGPGVIFAKTGVPVPTIRVPKPCGFAMECLISTRVGWAMLKTQKTLPITSGTTSLLRVCQRIVRFNTSLMVKQQAKGYSTLPNSLKTIGKITFSSA